MSLRTKIILSVLTLLPAATPAGAGLRDDVGYLADEVCAGRGTGTNGAVEASWYIMGRMRSLGYEPRMEAFDNGDAAGHNIICETPGKGPAILLMAHYDGFGRVEGQAVKQESKFDCGAGASITLRQITDGVFFPGADANASGVAGLLHLAEKLKDCGCHIIFAALDGHHTDLAGAKALKKSLEKARIRMVVNLETIGSSLAPVKSYYRSYFIILGGEPYKKQFSAISQDLSIKLYYDYYGSPEFTRLFHTVLNDQAPFLEAGVPSLMPTSGITSNSGKSGDRPETLDYEMLAQRLELTERFVRSFCTK